MMNSVQVFEKEEFGKIRTVLIEGDVWFVAQDVATCLEYQNSRTMTRRLDDDEKAVHLLHAPGGKQNFTIINESGLYSSIIGSKKKEAKMFKKWVTSEVLPSIRKTGSYINTKDAMYVAVKNKSKEVRNQFTKELKKREYKGYEYAVTTNAMKEPFGLKGKKKDDMTQRELETVMASELLAKLSLTDGKGFKEVNPVCVKASNTVKVAIENKGVAGVLA